MKPQKIWEYIQFGRILSYLRTAKQGYAFHGNHFILTAIDKVLAYIEKFDLNTTKQVDYLLLNFKESLEKTEGDYKLTNKDVNNLFKLMEKITAVIQAETTLFHVYLLTKKRIDVKKLVSNVESLFAPNLFKLLPYEIKYDFEQSGKCIAFDCATAGAFHALRGVEGLQRLLLIKLNPQANVQGKGWAQITKELKALNKSDISTIIDNLDIIRLNYRNPTNHPDMIYNIEKAQDLFNLCIGVVNQIVEYMKNNGFI